MRNGPVRRCRAVVDGPLRLTFAGWPVGSAARARIRESRRGQGGDRVAVWAPNSAYWMIAAFGVLTAGGVVVPVSTRYKAEGRRHHHPKWRQRSCWSKGFLGQDFSTPPGCRTRPEIRVPRRRAPFERAVTGTDVADIIYTSGTTGRPKA